MATLIPDRTYDLHLPIDMRNDQQRLSFDILSALVALHFRHPEGGATSPVYHELR